MSQLGVKNPWTKFEHAHANQYSKAGMSKAYAHLMHSRQRSPMRHTAAARHLSTHMSNKVSPIRSHRSLSHAHRSPLRRSNSWVNFEKSHKGEFSREGLKDMYLQNEGLKSLVIPPVIGLAASKSPKRRMQSPKKSPKRRAAQKSPKRRVSSPKKKSPKRRSPKKRSPGRPKNIQNRFNKCEHKNAGKYNRQQLLAKCA